MLSKLSDLYRNLKIKFFDKKVTHVKKFKPVHEIKN